MLIVWYRTANVFPQNLVIEMESYRARRRSNILFSKSRCLRISIGPGKWQIFVDNLVSISSIFNAQNCKKCLFHAYYKLDQPIHLLLFPSISLLTFYVFCIWIHFHLYIIGIRYVKNYIKCSCKILITFKLLWNPHFKNMIIKNATCGCSLLLIPILW